ncbi:Velvet domain superfamily protein [Pleurotus pulmonarius]
MAQRLRPGTQLVTPPIVLELVLVLSATDVARMNTHHISVFQHQPLPVQPRIHTSSPQLSNSHQSPLSHQPAGLDLIGERIHFSTGQFAGQVVRAELTEIQKADLGRKYARVDRRPLDPPPVVLLKLYITYPIEGGEREEEVPDYEQVHNHGLVCTVDLFPVPGADQPASGQSPPASSSSTRRQHLEDGAQRGEYFPAPFAASQGDTPPSPHSRSIGASNIVHSIDGFSITEGSKQTHALVGATFVQPATVEYQGRKRLVFVFSDLAVKVEGTFILRYRVFDLFSRPTDSDQLAIQAECYGRQFKVYSTKEFPGLQASTDLTKHLARWGVRLNIRETERKRGKKDNTSVSPVLPNAKKRCIRSLSDEGHSENE